MQRGLFIGVGVAILFALVVQVVVFYFPVDKSLSLIRQRGKIIIGYAVEAPYAFLTLEGQVTGESPEVASRMASRLGIARVEWRQVEFSDLIPELEAGRIDVIAAGMFITPEREQQVNFSLPTFRVQQGLLVLRGNPRQLHSYQQAFTLKEVSIAVLSGSVEEKLLQDLGFSAERLLIVPDANTGKMAVETGLADGLALSAPTLRWMVISQSLERLELAEPFDQPPMGSHPLGIGGFAFRKSDQKLIKAWNVQLGQFIGSPEHLALIQRFGFTSEELPPDVP